MRVVRHGGSVPETPPALLTVTEAAEHLRISRSLGYELARAYLATDGTEGLPVIRLASRLRVPRWALEELARTGRVVRLGDGATRLDQRRGRAG
jgi:hypothetical protein